MSRYRHIKFILLLMLSLYSSGCNPQSSDDDIFISERKRMVQKQIIARGIKNQAVINAMLTVKRHLFVPEKYINQAYDDCPLPIDDGQTISQPYIVAYMTEILDLNKSDRVLEIGTGSGYQAAVLAEICDSIFSIEIFPSLGNNAIQLYKNLGITNIYIKIGDGYKGWIEKSPFDAILVTCSPTHIPQPLINQLSEGGKMIIPVGPSYSQKLVLMKKENGKLIRKEVLPVRFVPMIDRKGSNY
ncbi:MAG: protein-L-isoaspartate(D-aspartate) O-methyltransferase [Bacteroidales bacterium]|nr:protein-L-isoaspartate(D-aspartate) O-methyltransferase [Bacteroidales bacterium]